MCNFIDQVKERLTFNNQQPQKAPQSEYKAKSLNTSLDDDYEFMDSDDDEFSDDEDDVMNINLRRLIEQENGDSLFDSGYSEEGTFKSASLLDHSYSKPTQQKQRVNNSNKIIKDEDINAVAGLLDLANAASKELEKITSSINCGTITNVTSPENSMTSDRAVSRQEGITPQVTIVSS